MRSANATFERDAWINDQSESIVARVSARQDLFQSIKTQSIGRFIINIFRNRCKFYCPSSRLAYWSLVTQQIVLIVKSFSLTMLLIGITRLHSINTTCIWITGHHELHFNRRKGIQKKIANSAENIPGKNVQAICFLGPDLPVRRPISCWERAACISPGDARLKPPFPMRVWIYF